MVIKTTHNVSVVLVFKALKSTTGVILKMCDYVVVSIVIGCSLTVKTKSDSI